MLENIKDLQVGADQDIILLVKSVENNESINGPYQKLVVRDKFDHEEVVMNFSQTQLNVQPPIVLKFRIKTEEYKSGISYQYMSSLPVENARVEDYLPKSQINQADSWNYLVQTSKSLRPGLKKIVGRVLSANSADFKAKALTPHKAFARRNGILEATCQLVKMAIAACDILGLDKDLMVSGAMLYYIGYVDCLDNGFMSTADEVLIGPGNLAYEKVINQIWSILASENEEVKMSLDMHDMKLLCHILLCRYRGNSPSIPEAYVLRNLDSILVETDAMKTALKDREPGSIVAASYVNAGKLYKR